MSQTRAQLRISLPKPPLILFTTDFILLSFISNNNSSLMKVKAYFKNSDK